MLHLEAVAVLLLLLAGPGHCAERKEPPPCKEGRQCLPYTVACHGDGYEARRYPASSWVGTQVVNRTGYMPALIHGFWRLFRYIQGANEQQVKIPMTSPVLARVPDGAPIQELRVYFMLPEAFRDNPPNPTEETVFLERFPAQEVYARFFGGWITDRNHQAQLRYLDEKLQEAGRTTQEGLHYTAGFNSPFELVNRRNEVWRIAQGALECSPTLEE